MLPAGDVLVLDAEPVKDVASPRVIEAARWLAGEGVQVALHARGPAVDALRLWVRPGVDGWLPYPRMGFAGCWIDGSRSRVDEAVQRVTAFLAPGAPLAVRGEIVAVGAAPAEGGMEPGPTSSDCPLCPARRFQANADADLPGAAGTLYADNHVIVMPDVAPVIEGHLLILTTHHHPCSAAVDAATWHAMERAKAEVRNLFGRAYGTGALFFEHGPARPQAAGSCIDHTHWHCLPTSQSIRPVIDAHGLHGTQLADRTLLRDWHRGGQSYLAVEEAFGEQNDYPLYAFSADDLPRQFLRWAAWRTLARPGDADATSGRREWLWHVTVGSPASRAAFLYTLNRLLAAQPVPMPPDSHQ
jgi:diadenosine tetraphosphate (Ap4A) HIT family hydrolase